MRGRTVIQFWHGRNRRRTVVEGAMGREAKNDISKIQKAPQMQIDCTCFGFLCAWYEKTSILWHVNLPRLGLPDFIGTDFAPAPLTWAYRHCSCVHWPGLMGTLA